MLPIAGETFPATADELIVALQHGFESRVVTPRAIHAEGGEFPELGKLSIDLTDAQFSRETQLGSDSGPNCGSLMVGRFVMFGAPLYFEETPVEARLEGYTVQLSITGEPPTGSLLLETAAMGAVSVKVTIQALEGLLQTVAGEAAAKQGIEVKKTKLTLKQEGPRAVSFRAAVTAKVFVMNADLALTGRLEIDDAFNARLSSLALDGDAMVTGLAGNFLRPRLQQLESRVFPLFAFLPAGLNLRDITVSVAPALHVQAHFGGDA